MLAPTALIHLALGLALLPVQSVHAQLVYDCSSVRLRSPKPAPLYCGSDGTVANPSVLTTDTYTARSYVPCRNLCLETQGCISFEHNSKTGACTLYKKSLHDMGYNKKQTQAGTVHYNRRCFSGKCTQTCSAVEPTVPEPPADNTVENPSFSPDSSGWTFNGQSSYSQSCDATHGYPYDGSGYALLQDSPSEYGGAIGPTISNAAAGQNYTVTFKYLLFRYGENTNHCELGLIFDNVFQDTTSLYSTTQTYQTYTFGPLDGGTTFSIAFACYGTGSDQSILNVDQVYFEPETNN